MTTPTLSNDPPRIANQHPTRRHVFTWRRRIALAAIAMLAWTTVLPFGASASPDDPDINFCGGDVSAKSEITTDETAGVTHSSSVFVPISEVPAADGTSAPVGIYFSNDGPGPITFANPSFSFRSEPIPRGTWTTLNLTPRGQVEMNDGNWANSFNEGTDFLGCIFLNADGVDVTDIVPRGSLHLDLNFTRAGEPHTVRVDLHFR